MSVRPGTIVAFVLLLLESGVLYAGEISGVPPPMPPFADFRFQIYATNDLLGQGGGVDDFRTQQVGLVVRLGPSWLAVVDHSILTLEDSPEPGRTDQMAASLGYSLVDQVTPDGGRNRLLSGIGVRTNGDLAGDRIQNSLHRLIGNRETDLPYIVEEQTDIFAWLLAERYQPIARRESEFGYWLRAASLITADGQWDGSLGAYLVARLRRVDTWLGLKADWRRGYSLDRVQDATADAESEEGVSLGVKYGPVLLETHQQFDGDTSFGQLSFIAPLPTFRAAQQAEAAYTFDYVMQFPDIILKLRGRRRTNLFVTEDSALNESLFLDVRYGKPQYRGRADLYNETIQLTAGIDIERETRIWGGALRTYGSIAVGWRREQLDPLQSPVNAIESSSRGVATVGTGVRVFAASLPNRGAFALDVGFELLLPFSSDRVALGSELIRVQRDTMSVGLGMSFGFP